MQCHGEGAKPLRFENKRSKLNEFRAAPRLQVTMSSKGLCFPIVGWPWYEMHCPTQNLHFSPVVSTAQASVQGSAQARGIEQSYPVCPSQHAHLPSKQRPLPLQSFAHVCIVT